MLASTINQDFRFATIGLSRLRGLSMLRYINFKRICNFVSMFLN